MSVMSIHDNQCGYVETLPSIGGGQLQEGFLTGLLNLVSKGVLGFKYYGIPRKLVPANHHDSVCSKTLKTLSLSKIGGDQYI